MSIIPYEEYAPHIHRSVTEEVWEYEAKHGRKPSAIFAEYKAHAALACSQEFSSTPSGFMWRDIPLRMVPDGEYGIYLVGEPVKIRLTRLQSRK